MNYVEVAGPLLPGIIALGKEAEFVSAAWTLIRMGFFTDRKKAAIGLLTSSETDQAATKDALSHLFDIMCALGRTPAYKDKAVAFMTGLMG